MSASSPFLQRGSRRGGPSISLSAYASSPQACGDWPSASQRLGLSLHSLPAHSGLHIHYVQGLVYGLATGHIPGPWLPGPGPGGASRLVGSRTPHVTRGCVPRPSWADTKQPPDRIGQTLGSTWRGGASRGYESLGNETTTERPVFQPWG